MPTNPPNPLPCGCRVAGRLLLPSAENDLHVKLCPLHEATEDLLTALELMLQLDDGWHVVGPEERAETRGKAYAVVGRTAAAILKARPAKVERAGTEVKP